METTIQTQRAPELTVTWGARSRRRKLGTALGIITLLALGITGPWYMVPAGIVLAVLHWQLSGLQIHAATEKAAWKANCIWAASMLGAMCAIIPLMVQAITLYIPFEGKFIMNLLCSGMIFGLFLLLTGNFRWAVNTAVGFMLMVATVNGYVFLFRDRELTFLDIYSASTALEVTGQYNFMPSGLMVCGWSLTALGLLVQRGLPKVTLKHPAYVRLGAAVSVGVALLAVMAGSRNYLPERWRTNGSIKNGYFLNFYLGIRDAFIQEPEDYSPETIGQMEQIYRPARPAALDPPQALPKPVPALPPVQEMPNILVIMNESYCDLSIYPQAGGTGVAVTPYWDSLQDNTIKGYALASVYGGNTANSEFEFLTGFSMAFLPNGSVPYSQYIEQPSYSLAWVLRSYGYRALATHGYHAIGWNRDQVYPLLGFESSTFLDSFPQEDFLRSYISDAEQYTFMLEQLRRQDGPTFLFGVTMQNHGGYEESRETYDHTVELTGDLEGFPRAEQYLSLLSASDQALEMLLTQLESYPEDTLVLIFGDHQPKLDPEFYTQLNGSPMDELADQMLQHTVPFLIWANYDIPEADLGLISLNYLAGHLLDAAGLERTAYHKYLEHLEQSIPAINALGYYSLQQQDFALCQDAQGEEHIALRDYALVQYNALFDRENSSDLFFDQYLPPEEGAAEGGS